MENNDTENSDLSIEVLNSKIEELSREIETINDALGDRQTESTTLRILLYTGLSVLLVGFILFTRTVQQAQLENMDSNLTGIQNKINLDMIAFQRNLLKEVALVKEMKKELDEIKQKEKSDESK